MSKEIDAAREVVRSLIQSGMLPGAFFNEATGTIVIPGDVPDTTGTIVIPGNVDKVPAAPVAPAAPEVPAAPAVQIPTAPVQATQAPEAPATASAPAAPEVPVAPAAQIPTAPVQATQAPEAPATAAAPAAPEVPAAPAVQIPTAPVQATQAPEAPATAAAPEAPVAQAAPEVPTAPAAPKAPTVPKAAAVEETEKIPFPWVSFGCMSFLILSLILLGIAIGGAGIAVLSVIALGFGGAWAYFYSQDKSRLYCRKCKRKFDFEDDIGYEEIGHGVKTRDYNEKSNSDHQVCTSEWFKMRIDCHCPQCGTEKHFTTKYTGRVTYYDGSIKDHDPEEEIEKYFKGEMMGGKLFSLIWVALGLIPLIISFMLFFGGGSAAGDATKDSKGDPEDYYATWYTYAEDDGNVCELHLSDNRTYTFTETHLLSGKTTITTGNIVYKSKKDIQKLFEGLKYDDKDALLLSTGQTDGYIIFWLSGEEGKDRTLEQNKLGLVFSREVISRELADHTKDPKNYYGTYYGVNETDFTELSFELKSDGSYKMTTKGVWSTPLIEEGSFDYLSPEFAAQYAKDPSLHEGQRALRLTEENTKKQRLVWFAEGTDSTVFEQSFASYSGDYTVLLGKEKHTLLDYLGSIDRYCGEYVYNERQKITIREDGTATLVENGTAKEYLCFRATPEYIKAKYGEDRDTSIVVYEKSEYSDSIYYWIFEIDGNALKRDVELMDGSKTTWLYEKQD